MNDQATSTEFKKDELFTEHLKYQGKMLDGEGTGPKGPWRKWKLSFDTGKQYPWAVKAFDSLGAKSGVKIADMKEGQYYEVIYKKQPYEGQYGPQIGKTAILIRDSDASKSTAGRSFQKTNFANSNQSNNTTTSGENRSNKESTESIDTTPVDWVKFSSEYNTAMKDKPLASPLHMLGAYVANQHPKQFKTVSSLCKKNFEEKR